MALDDNFVQALFGEDELGVVIRSHIHVEACLHSLLDLLVPHPSLLPRLRYHQMIDLACALGLRQDVAPPLRILGDIRNSFSHDLKTTLSDAKVTKLYEAFSPMDRQQVDKAYELTNLQLGKKLPQKIPELGARDKFIVIATTLYTLLSQAQDGFSAKQKLIS